MQTALHFLQRSTPRGREEEDDLAALIDALQKMLEKEVAPIWETTTTSTPRSTTRTTTAQTTVALANAKTTPSTDAPKTVAHAITTTLPATPVTALATTQLPQKTTTSILTISSVRPITIRLNPTDLPQTI